MRIQALERFSLLNFSTWQQSAMARGTCPPGEYELSQGVHPNENLRVYGVSHRPNEILYLVGHTGYGASLGWWENEVEAGRMR